MTTIGPSWKGGGDETPKLYTKMPNGRVQLHLHSGQQRAWQSEKRFVIVLAGTQSG